MGKAWRFFKTYINIGREKYVFLLLFAWKMITFGSLWEIRACPQIHFVKNIGRFPLSREGVAAFSIKNDELD